MIFRDDTHGLWLYHGNCLELLDAIYAKYGDDGRFDMIFADPPYFLSNGGITCHAGKMVKVDIYAENASGLSGTLSAAQLTSIGNTNGEASDNFFVGPSGNSTMSGYYNTAEGDGAFVSNTNGIANTADGALALLLNTSGSYNVADGAFAMNIDTNGYGNVAVGYDALGLDASGSYNIALGDQAGNGITNGSYNIDIGNAGVAGDNNIIRIGNGQSQAFIAGVINGNGGGLTSLNAANLAGTIPQSNLGTADSYSPTIGDGTDNFTMSIQDGYYVLVGNLVYFEIRLDWTSKGSAISTSSLRISLPFTVASERVGFSLAYLTGFTFNNQLTAGANNGASYLLLYNLSNSGGSPSNETVADCATSGEIQVSGVYRWQ